MAGSFRGQGFVGGLKGGLKSGLGRVGGFARAAGPAGLAIGGALAVSAAGRQSQDQLFSRVDAKASENIGQLIDNIK